MSAQRHGGGALRAPETAPARAETGALLRRRGQMVKEFNDVVFGEDYEVRSPPSRRPSRRRWRQPRRRRSSVRVRLCPQQGVVHGPIKTQFGYHLILITDRS